ncbi:hypothetical protein ACU4GH_28230 [Bradyrhizobium betae]
MTKTIDDAITEIVADIAKLEAEIREKKTTVNTLCSVAKREKMYQLDEQLEAAIPTRIRPDQFYGQPLASAVRTILEMRKQQNLGAATNNEIYDALIAGGYTFQTKTEDVARASLRNSLSKNTVTFHKLPNGRFGMLSWYPNAKPAKAAQNGTANTGVEEEEETETATEGAAAEE